MRVLHVITDLGLGGAERMLLKLARSLLTLGVEMEIVSLGERNLLGPEIEHAGIPVTALGMRRSSGLLFGVLQLARHIRRYNPDVVQTGLYHADLVGFLANQLAGGGRPLAWNLRCSDLDPASGKFSTRLIRRALIGLSALPDLVIANSASGLAAHQALGYRPRASMLLPNGFDLQEFIPDRAAGSELRNALDIGPGEKLIGMVARFHPMKDHVSFLRAAMIARAQRPGLRFILVGQGSEPDGPLANMASNMGLRSSICFLGRRTDVPAVFNALDLSTLTSAHGEGFANVLGEAMSCSTPCVATDVGDAAEIIAATGRIVPPRDPEALAKAWLEMLALPPEALRALGNAARQRMNQNYAIGVIAQRYAETYTALVRQGPTARY